MSFVALGQAKAADDSAVSSTNNSGITPAFCAEINQFFSGSSIPPFEYQDSGGGFVSCYSASNLKGCLLSVSYGPSVGQKPYTISIDQPRAKKIWFSERSNTLDEAKNIVEGSGFVNAFSACNN